MKKISKRVEDLLDAEPQARDSVALTIVTLWKQDLEYMGIPIKALVVDDFFKLLINNKLTNPQNVGRAWRLAQELNVHLRGKSYNKRHKILEPEVRGYINEIKKPDTLF